MGKGVSLPMMFDYMFVAEMMLPRQIWCAPASVSGDSTADAERERIERKHPEGKPLGRLSKYRFGKTDVEMYETEPESNTRRYSTRGRKHHYVRPHKELASAWARYKGMLMAHSCGHADHPGGSVVLWGKTVVCVLGYDWAEPEPDSKEYELLHDEWEVGVEGYPGVIVDEEGQCSGSYLTRDAALSHFEGKTGLNHFGRVPKPLRLSSTRTRR